MGVIGDRVTVTSGAAVALLDGNDFNGVQGVVKNITATGAVYLGGVSTVTAATGFQWDPADGPMQVNLAPGEYLYGIVAAASQTIHRLVSDE